MHCTGIAQLGFRKFRARLGPRTLLPDMKYEESDISRQLLWHYEHEGDRSLNDIVTGDGCWVHHFDP